MNLKAGIRTTEFWLVVAADVALATVSLLHGGLSSQHALQYGTELNGIYVVARSVPKGLAMLNGLLGIGVVDTTKADALGKKVAADVTAVVPVVEQVFHAPQSAAKPDPDPTPAVTPAVAETAAPAPVEPTVAPVVPIVPAPPAA